MVNISPNNSKMGDIPSISLPPSASCDPNALCMRDGCYALKSCYNRWPNVRNAWDLNLAYYQAEPVAYFMRVRRWLDKYIERCNKKNKQPYFRWHVGGDFPDQEYVRRVVKLANQLQQIKFMAFTKRYNFTYPKPPLPNLCIRFSSWPKHPMPLHLRPLSITDDGTETRFKHLKLYQCPAHCDQCYACWNPKVNVIGDKH